MANKEALQKLLMLKRQQLDPAKFGIARRRGGRGRTLVAGLTQGEACAVLGWSEGTYGKVERGDLELTAPRFEELARLFEFTEEDWRNGWSYSFGGEPPYPLHPQTAYIVVPHWIKVLGAMGVPGYISCPGWNILATNPGFQALFLPGDEPSNMMRWMILDPRARELYLGDWAASWATAALPQLRAAVARHPDNETLQKLEHDVLLDEEAGPLYRSCPDSLDTPDGHTRPFRHPVLGWTQVTLCAAMPQVSPGQLLMCLLFDTGAGA
ncbi:helix-turn-helix transcriptional regulator [Kitasatospora sp. NPDC088783]|uniref:helix-turn-helix transcriptional regulator n=1 Tax=Kitasatospora sp. NPDC088783 TaxID=3364077 RepID=UPI003813BC08